METDKTQPTLTLAAALPPLIAHEEMQRRTLTESPLVLLQTRGHTVDEAIAQLKEIVDKSDIGSPQFHTAKLSLDALSECWQTDRVFLDPVEAERFVDAQRHRYPEDRIDEDWRFYVGIAEGCLRDIAPAARTAANL